MKEITKQKLWDMAKVIVEKQKDATIIDIKQIDTDLLEELWFDWLEENLLEEDDKI
jgi:hypothetical protein